MCCELDLAHAAGTEGFCEGVVANNFVVGPGPWMRISTLGRGYWTVIIEGGKGVGIGRHRQRPRVRHGPKQTTQFLLWELLSIYGFYGFNLPCHATLSCRNIPHPGTTPCTFIHSIHIPCTAIHVPPPVPPSQLPVSKMSPTATAVQIPLQTTRPALVSAHSLSLPQHLPSHLSAHTATPALPTVAQ